MTDERPHFIEREGKLEPASIEELVDVVAQHVNHDGIAYFENCSACRAAREAGEYPQWFKEDE